MTVCLRLLLRLLPRRRRGLRDLERRARPLRQLLRIVVQPVGQREPRRHHRLAALVEGEGLALLFVGLEVDDVVEDHADHRVAGIDAVAAEEALDRDPPELREQIVEAAAQAGFAGVIETLSPQPQAAVWFGLLKTKRAPSFSRTKSISVPIRNRIALGSMKIFTPLSSTTSSSGFTSSA